MMKKYDSRTDTQNHIGMVKVITEALSSELYNRGIIHDESKLSDPEKETFDRVTPLLKSLTYGSGDYKAALESMGDALEHHYKNNRHHPEHFKRGISGMNIVDLVEMFCDWCAATERHDDGSIGRSISQQARRFEFGPVLANIFLNTATDFNIGKNHESTNQDYFREEISKGGKI